jgi:hypothetical protein
VLLPLLYCVLCCTLLHAAHVCSPRRHFLEQVCAIIATSERGPIPIFSDKHISFNWEDASFIYKRITSLGIPFMAGSSVPLM